MSEPLSENARLLLAHRLDLYAPDMLLAEFANVICKKVRRRELQASPRYIDALMIDMVDEHYTLGLGHHWREGYERLTGVSL